MSRAEEWSTSRLASRHVRGHADADHVAAALRAGGGIMAPALFAWLLVLSLASVAAGGAAGCRDSSSDLITRIQGIGCVDSDQCPTSWPVCDPPTARCRGCATDRECTTASSPFCDATSGACVECGTSDHCLDPELPICDPSEHRCVQCLTDGHCPAVDEQCNTIAGRCGLLCSTAAACPPQSAICDVPIGFCVECRVDDDCPFVNFPYCRRSVCTPP